MYRVLLIDDENIIVEGLRRVVKWEDYNCQVVGTAQDACSCNEPTDRTFVVLLDTERLTALRVPT